AFLSEDTRFQFRPEPQGLDTPARLRCHRLQLLPPVAQVFRCAPAAWLRGGEIGRTRTQPAAQGLARRQLQSAALARHRRAEAWRSRAKLKVVDSGDALYLRCAASSVMLKDQAVAGTLAHYLPCRRRKG